MCIEQDNFQKMIIGLIPPNLRTKQAVDKLLAKWDEYFLQMDIYTEKQKIQEFENLQRVYLSSGIVSIAPPELDNAMVKRN